MLVFCMLFFFNFFFLGLTEGTKFSLLAQQICTFIIRFHLFVTIVTVYSSVELRTQSTTNRECDLWYHHYPSDFYLIFRLRPGRKTTSCHAMIHHCYSWRLIFPFLHYALTKQNSPLIHTWFFTVDVEHTGNTFKIHSLDCSPPAARFSTAINCTDWFKQNEFSTDRPSSFGVEPIKSGHGPPRRATRLNRIAQRTFSLWAAMGAPAAT